MSKEEIINYYLKNSELPENVEIDYNDEDFINQLIRIDQYIIDLFPVEVQRKYILRNPSFLKMLLNNSLDAVFSDDAYTEKLFTENFDALFYLRGVKVKSEYLKELIASYIYGTRPIPKDSQYYGNPKLLIRLYTSTIWSIKTDLEITKFIIEKDISNLFYVELPEFLTDIHYVKKYLLSRPYEISKYYETIKDNIDEEIVAAVIKEKFENYKIFDKNLPAMKSFYDQLKRLQRISPGLTLENKSLRYELLLDPDFIAMDESIIASLLYYFNDSIDILITAKKEGQLSNLLEYIRIYRLMFDDTLECIQDAITTYSSVKDIFIELLKNPHLLNEKLLTFKSIISNGNIHNIKTIEEFLNYENITKDYYQEKVTKSSDIEEIRNLYCQILFNSTYEDTLKFSNNFLHEGIEELIKYARQQNIVINKEYIMRFEIFKRMSKIEDIEKLKTLLPSMPLPTCNIEEFEKIIRTVYSTGFNNSFLDLDDPSLQSYTTGDVRVINLEGQDFSLLIHRIYNFNQDLTSVANQILANPLFWNLAEGATTISSTLITSKKIAGVFSEIRSSSTASMIHFRTKEEQDEWQQKVIEEERIIKEGIDLPIIDDEAVFYGFTAIEQDTIIRMDSTDEMVEHGLGKKDIKVSNCHMMQPQDIAFWTRANYWNEIVLSRQITNAKRRSEYQKEMGSTRLQPTCIVCFDNKINKNSLLAARTFGIPIVNIDRRKYIEKQKQELTNAREAFSISLESSYLDRILYNITYDKFIDEIPRLIGFVNKSNLDSEKKLSALTAIREKLAYFLAHANEEGYYYHEQIVLINKKLKQYIIYINNIINRLANNEDYSFEEPSTDDKKISM